MSGRYEITMEDGSVWAIPIDIIARNRAEHYAYEFDGDIERSLLEDTMPLFKEDSYNVCDWAKNNMNWDDIETHAEMLRCGAVDFQEGWVNGKAKVIWDESAKGVSQ